MTGIPTVPGGSSLPPGGPPNTSTVPARGSHGHGGVLYRPGDTPLHRLPPQCKLAATFLFVLAVVSTPREAVWAYALHAALLVAVAMVGRVPLGHVARKLVIETPFLAFALFLPLVGGGERVDVLGVGLSVEGLWAAWNIVVKGTLGVAATVLMASTTPVPEILHGLERLRLPSGLTTVATFMVRYADVIAGELRRMRVARESRGYDPRWLWQARAVAAGAGTLFIRSYERGERVYLAMLSRGYSGAMPVPEDRHAPAATWLATLALPAAAALVSLTAWSLR